MLNKIISNTALIIDDEKFYIDLYKSMLNTFGLNKIMTSTNDKKIMSILDVKGAFTGAVSKRTGLVDKANGGTLFLDEISDLILSSQVKLLRLLQEREYTPLGSDEIKTSVHNVFISIIQLK